MDDLNVRKREEEIEIEENEDEERGESGIERYDISSYPADFTVKGLVDKLKENKIVLPDFQRRFIWDIRKQSRLIESILLGLPIPQIFLFRKAGKPYLYIIDGYQRLQTLRNFLEDNLKLDLDDDNPWRGYKFSDLSEEDKSIVEDYVIRSIIIRQIKPDNEDLSMFYIFERLNTGGVILTPMEIRRAIYYGRFLKMLEELNEDNNWRTILGKKEKDKRFRDLEWILRFFAFYLRDVENYRDPLKNYLNLFMREFKNQYSEEWKEVFRKTTARVVEALGDKPFHIPKGRLNLAVMDSVMVAIAKNPDLTSDEIREIYEDLKKDDKFLELITVRDTSKTLILKERFNFVFKKFRVINEN
jgi:hypothetical protein